MLQSYNHLLSNFFAIVSVKFSRTGGKKQNKISAGHGRSGEVSDYKRF